MDLTSPDGPKLVRYLQRISRAPASENSAGPSSAPFTLGRLEQLGLRAKTADPTGSGSSRVAFAWHWAWVNKPCWILRVCKDPAWARLRLPRVILNEWVLTVQVELTTSPTPSLLSISVQRRRGLMVQQAPLFRNYCFEVGRFDFPRLLILQRAPLWESAKQYAKYD